MARELREAIPFGQGPCFLIRDNDYKLGDVFDRVADGTDIEILPTSQRGETVIALSFERAPKGAIWTDRLSPERTALFGQDRYLALLRRRSKVRPYASCILRRSWKAMTEGCRQGRKSRPAGRLTETVQHEPRCDQPWCTEVRACRAI